MQLSRQDTYRIMQGFEEVDDIDSSELVDITSELFTTLDTLQGTQMLCKPDFDLNDTMSAFEVGCPKMDVRFHRKEVVTPKKARQLGHLPDKLVDNSQKDKFVNELLTQFATCLKSATTLGQTVFNSLYFADMNLSKSDDFIRPCLDSMIYIVNCYMHAAYKTSVLRDEEITFGVTTGAYEPEHNKFVKPVEEILAALEQMPVETDSQRGAGQMLKCLVQMCALQLDPLKPKLQNLTLAKLAQAFAQVESEFCIPADHPSPDSDPWLKVIFCEHMVSAIPYTINKRKFEKMSASSVTAFYKLIATHIIKLNFLHQKMQAKEIYLPEFKMRLDEFMTEQPCTLTRIVFESVIFNNDQQICGIDMRSWLQSYTEQVSPISDKFANDPLWLEYMSKQELMTREKLSNCLKNEARQRRGTKRLLNDLAVLLPDASYTDEQLIQKYKLSQSKTTSSTASACNLAISYTTEVLVRYLQHCFTLDMIRPEEFSMHFFQLTKMYNMSCVNRKVYIQGLLDDLAVKKIVDIEDLNSNVVAKLKQKRKKMTLCQRQLTDESELFQLLSDAFRGLFFLGLACDMKGATSIYYQRILKTGEATAETDPMENVFQHEEVLEQIYNARFGLFQRIPTPRYVSFAEYLDEAHQCIVAKNGFGGCLDEAKAYLQQASKRIGNLVALEEAQRNTVMLPQEKLVQLQKLLVRNGLMVSKAKMMGDKGFKLIHDASNSISMLMPAFDVVKT